MRRLRAEQNASEWPYTPGGRAVHVHKPGNIPFLFCDCRFEFIVEGMMYIHLENKHNRYCQHFQTGTLILSIPFCQPTATAQLFGRKVKLARPD